MNLILAAGTTEYRIVQWCWFNTRV